MARNDKKDKKDKKERMAGERMMPEGGRKELRGSSEGKYFYNKKGKLKQRTEDNNPFDVETLDDFDLTAAGSGSHRGIERLGSGELRSLRDEGRSREELIEYADGLDEGQLRGRAQKVLAKWTDKIKNGEDPTPVTPDDPNPGPDPDPGTKEVNKIINNGDGNASVIGDGTAIGGNNKQIIDNSFTWKNNDVTVKGSNYGNIGSVVTGADPYADSSRFSAGDAAAGSTAGSTGLDFSGVPNLRKDNKKRLKDINATTTYLSTLGTLGLVKLYGTDLMPMHWSIPASGEDK